MSRFRRFLLARRFRPFRDQRGAAAVEFALLLPLLMLILLGTIDFGRFGFAAITVTNAARHAASACTYGPICNLTDAQIKDRVKDEASPNLNLDDSLPTVDITWSKNATDPTGVGCTVTSPCLEVQVSYRFDTLFSWPGIPDNIWITRTARMPRGIVP